MNAKHITQATKQAVSAQSATDKGNDTTSVSTEPKTPNIQIQETYFLKSAIETAHFNLKNLSQLFAIIHNHELDKEQLESLLWTMWTATEQAITDLKENGGV